MSLALAGHFNLELYLLNLSSFERGDRQLELIFELLPQKCIVLLEDIDSAGIKRENVRADGKDKNKNESQPRSSVTLSGLLNAIDGVASQEGRILLMTTNDPETLDEAMIRPGRIDVQAFFGPVSGNVAEQIFIRMYTKDEDDSSHSIPPTTAPSPTRPLPKSPKSIITGLLGMFTTLTLWASLTSWLFSVFGPVYAFRFFFDDPVTAKEWLTFTLAVTVLFISLQQLTSCAWYALRNRTRSNRTTATVAAGTSPSFFEAPVVKPPTPRTVLEAANTDFEQLRQMASTFGSKIPEGKFTPAEIQGYLVMNMESASAALGGIDAWVSKLLAAKEQGKNIISDGLPPDDKKRIDRGQQTDAGDLAMRNVKYTPGSPTSVLSPLTAKDYQKLSAYFSYSPKGAPDTPELKLKQKATVDYFKNAEMTLQTINGDKKEEPKPPKKVIGKKLNPLFTRVKAPADESAKDQTTSRGAGPGSSGADKNEELPATKLKGGGEAESGEPKSGEPSHKDEQTGDAAAEAGEPSEGEGTCSYSDWSPEFNAYTGFGLDTYSDEDSSDY